MPLRSKITVSAPGKLLFAGGYLVLEAPNIGVVIAVDKRFYCDAELHDAVDATSLVDIEVESPQFGQKWNYIFDKDKKLLRPDAAESENTFVEKSLCLSLLALLDEERHDKLARIRLRIKGDNDFYSLIPHLAERGMSKTLEGALALPNFLPAPRVNGKIVKTGLGSSACLVTSLVASLCYSLKSNEGDDSDKIESIFRLAQICHCHSQGKLGSGFDVAAACYGSHIYERFPKSLLADLLTMLEDDSVPVNDLQSTIRSILVTKWDGGIRQPLNLPSFVQVMLADVSGGSESPSMARTVLTWKKGIGSQQVPHWDDLIHINQQIGELLQKLCSRQMDNAELESLITSNVEAWKTSETGRLLSSLRVAAQESRHHLKAMGEAAGVPIEPDEQTTLIDGTMQIPGVIAGLVPGAGGYDAIACLYVNHPRVRHAVADFWCSWPKASVCPLTVQGARHGEGIRVES